MNHSQFDYLLGAGEYLGGETKAQDMGLMADTELETETPEVPASAPPAAESGVAAQATKAVVDGANALADSAKKGIDSVKDGMTAMFAPSEPMSDASVTGWQLAVLFLTLTVAFLTDFKHKGGSTNKRNIALMVAFAGAAIQLWLLVMYYRTARGAGYWAMVGIMALIMAVIVYFIVVLCSQF